MIFGMNSLEVVVWVLGILVVGGGISFGGEEKPISLPLVKTGQPWEKEWNSQVLLQHLSHTLPQQAQYEETHVSTILTMPIVSTGTLSFTPSFRLEKHVFSPREERYIIEGDSLLWEEMATGQTRELFLPDFPLLQTFVEGFRAVFAGDLVTLRTWFAIELTGDQKVWTLKLTPIDEDIREFVDALHFVGQGGRITGIEIREISGDYSHIKILTEGM